MKLVVVKNKSNNNNKQWPQVLSTVSACIGMFCAGMCFAWSSPSIAILTSENTPINITRSEASWIASLLQLGSAFSPIVGAILTKTIGPKITILMSTVPYLLGFIMIVFAKNVAELCISRLISGIAVGLSFSATPIYVSEISETRYRGAHMVIFSTSMNIGSLFVTSVAPYVSIFTMARIMLAFPAILLITFVFAPDSPLFYLRNNRESKALGALCQLRRQPEHKNVEEELLLLKNSIQQGISIMDSLKEFARYPNPKALGMVYLTVICQQTCGAITSILYLELIFKSVSLPVPANVAVIITAIISNAFALCTLRVVDIWGRRPLLILSAAGCAISNACLGSYYFTTHNSNVHSNLNILAIVGVVLLQVSYSIGLNSVPYVIAGEVFSSNSREIGICLTSTGGALLGFVVSKLYQIVNDAFGGGVVFLTLMSLTIVFGSLIYILVPETKGKTFDEIQITLKKSKLDRINNTYPGAIEKNNERTRF